MGGLITEGDLLQTILVQTGIDENDKRRIMFAPLEILRLIGRFTGPN